MTPAGPICRHERQIDSNFSIRRSCSFFYSIVFTFSAKSKVMMSFSNSVVHFWVVNHSDEPWMFNSILFNILLKTNTCLCPHVLHHNNLHIHIYHARCSRRSRFPQVSAGLIVPHTVHRTQWNYQGITRCVYTNCSDRRSSESLVFHQVLGTFRKLSVFFSDLESWWSMAFPYEWFFWSGYMVPGQVPALPKACQLWMRSLLSLIDI